MAAKASMADRAYCRLKRDIVEARLRPGSVLSDSDLAEQYEMSRTPIREAINNLRREGLVVVLPKRGTFVKSIDFAEIHDLYTLRTLVEPEAAVLASRRASGEELAELEELSAQSVDSDASASVRNARNSRLHVRVAELSDIPLLARTVQSIHEEIERCLNLRRELGRPYNAVNHGRLVDAIMTGDDEVIRKTALSGIERARDHMTDVLFSHSGGPPGELLRDG